MAFVDQDAKKGKGVFNIFLMVLGVSLIIFIGIWLYDIYSSNRASSSEVSKNILSCTGYVFDVDTSAIIYSGNKLSFIVENDYGDKFDALVVRSDSGEEFEAVLDNFMQGSSTVVSVENMPIGSYFEAYPKGCPDNVKRFNVKLS